MATSDLDTITTLTVQIGALQAQADKTTDPSAKALIVAQIGMLTAQLSATAQHAQSQADASANLLNGLGLFSTLSSTVGTLAPTILSLFKP